MVKPGYKETEIGVIPEAWSISTLKSIFTKIEAGVSVNSDNSIFSDYYILKTSAVHNGVITISEVKPVVRSDYSRLKCPLVKGSILFSRMNTPDLVGECAYNTADPSNIYLPDRLWQIQNTKPSKIDFCWLNYLLNTPKYRDAVRATATGTSNSMKNISKERLLEIKISLPPLEEQQKIAEALSDMNGLIASLEKLIAKKKAIKQGAMQELLTGKKRLPEFSGEWIQKTIMEIALVGRGRVISHNEISKSQGQKYPVYSSQTFNYGIMGYLDTFDFDGEYITWTTDGVNAGTVYYRNGKFNCTNVCGILKLHSCNAKFIAYVLSTETPKYVSTNLANPKLMNDVMKKIIVNMPENIIEQQAIASILSNMDAEVEALEQNLQKCRQTKQGMMQQLLTGKIRLV